MDTASIIPAAPAPAPDALLPLLGGAPAPGALPGANVGPPAFAPLAAPADVVRSIVYVVSPDSSVLTGVWRQLNESALAPAFTTASTLLGVTALGYQGQLIEVDLTAALP